MVQSCMETLQFSAQSALRTFGSLQGKMEILPYIRSIPMALPAMREAWPGHSARRMSMASAISLAMQIERLRISCGANASSEFMHT